MDVYFFFNHIDSVLDLYKKKFIKRLTKTSDSIAIEPIGDLPGMDAIGGPNAITEKYCLRRIDFVTHRYRRRDLIILTGTVAGLYIDSIVKNYPNFNYYFLKNTDRPMTTAEMEFYLDFGEFDENWLNSINSTIITNMDSFSNRYSINWEDDQVIHNNTKNVIKIARRTI